MYAKVFRLHGSVVLAACDDKLVGKTLKEGKISVHINPDFYRGEKVDKEGLKNMLKEADNINLFGEETVKVAVELGLADEGSILRINGVPHLQIYKMHG